LRETVIVFVEPRKPWLDRLFIAVLSMRLDTAPWMKTPTEERSMKPVGIATEVGLGIAVTHDPALDKMRS